MGRTTRRLSSASLNPFNSSTVILRIKNVVIRDAICDELYSPLAILYSNF